MGYQNYFSDYLDTESIGNLIQKFQETLNEKLQPYFSINLDDTDFKTELTALFQNEAESIIKKVCDGCHIESETAVELLNQQNNEVITKLRDEVEVYNNAIAEFEQRIQLLDNNFAQITNENKALSELLLNKEQQLTQLQTQCDTFKLNAEALDAARDEALKANELLNQRLLVETGNLEKEQQSVAQLKDTVSVLEKEKIDLSATIESQATMFNSLETEYNEQSSVMESLISEKQSMVAQLDEIQHDFDEMRDKLQLTIEDSLKSEQQIENLSQSIEENDQKLNESKALITELSEELTQNKEALELSQKRVNELDDKRKQLLEEVASQMEINQQIESDKQELQRVVTEFEGVKASLSAQISLQSDNLILVEEKAKELESIIEGQKKEIDLYTQESAKSNKLLDSLKELNAQQQLVIETLKADNELLSTSLTQAQDIVDESQSKINELTFAKVMLEEELASLNVHVPVIQPTESMLDEEVVREETVSKKPIRVVVKKETKTTKAIAKNTEVKAKGKKKEVEVASKVTAKADTKAEKPNVKSKKKEKEKPAVLSLFSFDED